jgi:DNA-binding GntR family transcriptional regulator
VTLSRQTLAEGVYNELRNAITSGELADGIELNQVALAEQFGTSRIPVREALQRLMAEDLVIGDSYRRIVVATMGAGELAELLTIREELEVLGLKQLLSNGTPFDVTEARRLNKAFGAERSGERRISWDCSLHALMLVDSPVALRMVNDIRTKTQKYVGRVQGGTARRADAHREHEEIIVAIESADRRGAVRLLRAHISCTRLLLTKAALPGTSTGSGAAGPTGASRG